MSNIWGADASQLEGLATDMSSAADQLGAASARLTMMLASSPWSGRDADSMRNDWSATLKPSLVVVADALRLQSTELRNNARAQTQASSEGGGGLAALAVAALAGTAAASTGNGNTDKRAAPQSDEVRERLRQSAMKLDERYGDKFPDATAKLQAWAERMGVGEHTDQEWDAFARYRLAVTMAAATSNSVNELLDIAAEQLHASASSASALLDGFPGSDEARDALMSAITSGSAEQLRDHWNALMDDRLEVVESYLMQADSIGRMEYGDVMGIHMESESSQIEVIRMKVLEGDTLDFLRGTGSDLDNQLRETAGDLSKPVGAALEISAYAGNSLATVHEARVAAAALQTASNIVTSGLDTSFNILIGGTHG